MGKIIPRQLFARAFVFLGFVPKRKMEHYVKQSRQTLYFVNVWVDFAFIGGSSIALYFLLRFFHSGVRTDTVYEIGLLLLWVINWPHFAATNFRLYQSRHNMMQYPLTSFLVPAVILVGVVYSFLSLDYMAPLFVKFLLFWSPYHYCGQTVGITQIYSRRASYTMNRLEKGALQFFIFGSYFILITAGNISTEGGTYFGIPVPGLGLPAWTLQVSKTVTWSAGALLVGLIVRWCIQNKKILPPIVLLPAVVHYFWFVEASKLPAFLEFIPVFHGLQYLLIVWAMQLKDKMDRYGIRPSRSYVKRETLRWLALIIIQGIVLFKILPFLCSLFGFETIISMAIFTAGVQIHHFFADGVIWKLRYASISSPLMVSLSELIKPKPKFGKRAA